MNEIITNEEKDVSREVERNACETNGKRSNSWEIYKRGDRLRADETGKSKKTSK